MVFSVELAVYDGLKTAEIIPGIWELDNQLTPIVVGVQGDRVALTAFATGTSQTARFHDLVRETLGLFDVVRGHQHGRARRAQCLHHIPQVLADLGIESDSRLVEQQQTGGREDAPGKQ